MRRLWFIASLGSLSLPEIVRKLSIKLDKILQVDFLYLYTVVNLLI